MRSSVSPTFAWVVVKIIVNNTTTYVEHTAPTVDLKRAKNRGAKEDRVITRASTVGIYVSDQDRALDFYTGKLRSEEHTSELQSRQYLVCRLLLEKKKS